MNGCIIPGTPFAVDYWKTRGSPDTKFYFLSHMHADHTSGLSPSWKSPIYCSEISGKLLVAKFNIQKGLVKTLEVGQSHIIPLDEEGIETMTVSLIDANHCPGAVMFLFVGYFGTILYTGDFRYTPVMFIDTPLSSNPPVDVLYLDNTYCHPNCQFLSRDQAKSKIFQIIAAHPEHDILLGMNSLGKEDLLVDIAMEFETWIVVTPTRLEMLKLLELPDVFTDDRQAGRIRLAPSPRISKEYLTKLDESYPTIAIIPTALYTGVDFDPYANMDNVFIVPYSDHSAYPELHEFVSRVRPKSIVPIVQGSARGILGSSLEERAILSCFDEYLDPVPQKEIKIPPSVQKIMMSRNFVDTAIPAVLRRKNSGILQRKRERDKMCIKESRKVKGVVFSSQESPDMKRKEPRDQALADNEDKNITSQYDSDKLANSKENEKDENPAIGDGCDQVHVAVEQSNCHLESKNSNLDANTTFITAKCPLPHIKTWHKKDKACQTKDPYYDINCVIESPSNEEADKYNKDTTLSPPDLSSNSSDVESGIETDSSENNSTISLSDDRNVPCSDVGSNKASHCPESNKVEKSACIKHHCTLDVTPNNPDVTSDRPDVTPHHPYVTSHSPDMTSHRPYVTSQPCEIPQQATVKSKESTVDKKHPSSLTFLAKHHKKNPNCQTKDRVLKEEKWLTTDDMGQGKTKRLSSLKIINQARTKMNQVNDLCIAEQESPSEDTFKPSNSITECAKERPAEGESLEYDTTDSCLAFTTKVHQSNDKLSHVSYITRKRKEQPTILQFLHSNQKRTKVEKEIGTNVKPLRTAKRSLNYDKDIPRNHSVQLNTSLQTKTEKSSADTPRKKCVISVGESSGDYKEHAVDHFLLPKSKSEATGSKARLEQNQMGDDKSWLDTSVPKWSKADGDGDVDFFTVNELGKTNKKNGLTDSEPVISVIPQSTKMGRRRKFHQILNEYL
ncbi:5' exonuclease Apollo isoform X1 [Lingula anatina]|uniref:5' exonuclease Apollo n=2 Tax=Lingula anatina TaxID=7574 RepID=A0A1S3HIS9_LINAN|nr:5' exonuclease Apollo isoform X1 [Lingula anatina]|eukprot:XP_013386025.1 5' exonuclease Apollo isoform X1 [Lingula anatina]